MSQHRDDEPVLAERAGTGSADAGGDTNGGDSGAVRPRRELLAWRNAVFAIFFLSGLSMASWVARIPVVRDDTGLSTQGVGLVILGGSTGVGARPHRGAMADGAVRRTRRHDRRARDRVGRPRLRRHRRLAPAVGSARRDRARAVRIRQRRGRRDDERRGRRGRARDRQDADAAHARLLQLRHGRRRGRRRRGIRPRHLGRDPPRVMALLIAGGVVVAVRYVPVREELGDDPHTDAPQRAVDPAPAREPRGLGRRATAPHRRRHARHVVRRGRRQRLARPRRRRRPRLRRHDRRGRSSPSSPWR